jgi:phosphinothricin acetyltransferase
MIREATREDAMKIAEIYNYFIRNTVVSFEEEETSGQDFIDRMARFPIKEYPWFVYEEDGELLAYAYAIPWKTRSAYRNSAETSIYVKHGFEGRGIGKKLYSYLIDYMIAQKMHVVIGGIALPNDGSVALHEKMGFKKVAHFEQVGYKFDKWIDVAYWGWWR